MAATLKMEHLREWKEIICSDKVPEESRPKMQYLEMLRYPHCQQPVKDEGTVDESSLSDWLFKDLQLPSLSSENLSFRLPTGGELQSPSGGQRLMFGICIGDTESEERIGRLPFSSNSWHIIRDKLALPNHFINCMLKKGSPSFKVSTPEQSGRSVTCFIFKFQIHRPGPGYYQLALSYDKDTHLTHGLLLAMTTKGQEVPKLLERVKDRIEYCEQPLILAALAAELVIESCAAKIELVDGDLNALEDESGLHRYDNRPKGNPLEMDFMRAIQILHFSNRTLGLDNIRLQFIVPSLAMIVMESKKIASQELDRSRDVEKTETRVFISDGLRMMEELVGYLKHYCENQLLRARFQDNRIQTQLTVVSRLMAQYDTKVNIALQEDTSILARASKEDSAVMRTIAVDTKRDSSSMKTIAVLGMLFLPSTLLAALFQAPMINWDIKGRPVTTAAFKYFWAIAVPLTLLVLFTWAVATLLSWEKLLSKRRLGSAARERYSLELDDVQTLERG